MKSKILSVLVVLLLQIINPYSSFSQKSNSYKNDQLTSRNRSEIIEKTKEIFLEYYPLPEVSLKMINYLNEKQKKGDYHQFKNVKDFTSQLTKDLRKISNDDHIRVYPYEKIPDDLLAEIKLGYPENNFGFQKVEIQTGNIGYINLTTFNNPKSAGPTAIAAMNFVANSDALIIDLRLNGGGDEAMAQLISSYFFDKSTHLTDNFIRKDSITEQRWTQEWVSGPRITEVPIYILMSNYSYSSAEVLAYQLQQLKRAKIVGEKTRGGAHGVRYMSFPDILINLKVPYSQEINPYSKTNYINGVIPDFPCSSDKALIVAQLEAAKELLKTETDSLKKHKLEWSIAGKEIELNPKNIGSLELSEYQGIYKNIKISIEREGLILQRGNSIKQEMIPMGNDVFKYKDINEEKYRIQFTRNENGIISGMYDFDSDGDKYPLKEKTN
ncbi:MULTISPECIES: S41 family peptidase [unclassified Lentimicrobium]|uniref:S41 family peptidase n=1 Tax=unclassified Lentimicrobium TaxID=2677434 RepID=UPI0015572611|nr:MULTISPECIES: S41 family peptidase [unclassified Lentimicrobium]NPD47351.1 S41 family peptidase [Lentimicrobium sp. S6]NPD85447.1 S41 family peptidase [Lentimicrobium sp. L6]